MPNTGLFYLLAVTGNPREATQTTCDAITTVRAECLSCHDLLCISEPPWLVNISGGAAAIQCPKCGIRQAISAARFADFIERFPAGAELEAEVGAPSAAASGQQNKVPGPEQ